MNNKNGYIFALILLAITLAYGFFQARVLIHGPVLSITSPKSGETVTDTLMEINGKTENVTHVTINGQPITMDISGTFTEKRITPNGYGVVLIEAKDRFGHTTKEYITFLGEPSSTTTSTSS
jgi:hypothetical protein